MNELGGDVDEQIHDIISDFETNEFRELFSDDDGGTTTTLGVMQVPHSYTGRIIPVHHGAGVTWCGGNYDDPHLDPARIPGTEGSSIRAIQQILRDDGYRPTAWYVGVNPQRDFTLAVPSTNYDGFCDRGAFRNHALITSDSSYWVQNEEPNPEVLSYVWPDPMWGVYVFWWHQYGP